MKNIPSTRKPGRPRMHTELRVDFRHCKVRPATNETFRRAAWRDNMSVGQVLDQIAETLNS